MLKTYCFNNWALFLATVAMPFFAPTDTSTRSLEKFNFHK